MVALMMSSVGCGGGGSSGVVSSGTSAAATAPSVPSAVAVNAAVGGTAVVGQAQDTNAAQAGVQSNLQVGNLPPSQQVNLVQTSPKSKSGKTTVGSGQTDFQGNVTFFGITFTSGGTFEITDANGNVLASFTVKINQLPTASAGADKSGTAGTAISITGSASDPDGDSLFLAWKQVSGVTTTITNGNTVTMSFTPVAAGTFVFSFTATDPLGDSDTDQVSVTVTAAATGGGGDGGGTTPTNQNPSVSASASPATVTTGNAVTLSATASDPDNDTIFYAWTQTSGPAVSILNSSTKDASFTPTTGGTYVFQVTVLDGKGGTATASVTVTANDLAAPNQAPTAAAGSNAFGVGYSSTAILAGTGTDPENGTLAYKWTQASSDKHQVTIVDSDKATASFVTTGPTGVMEALKIPVPSEYSILGVPDMHEFYHFTLTVTDPNGLTATASKTVDPGTRGSSLTNVGVGSLVYFNAPVLSIYSWTLESKPSSSTAMLVGANTRNPLLIPDVVGKYTVKEAGQHEATLTISAGTYVGVNNCKSCHSKGGFLADNLEKYDDWAQTWHASKLQRHLDGVNGSFYADRCTYCHTTGFDLTPTADNAGFDDAARAANWVVPSPRTAGTFDAQPASIKNLAGIQCESCHGPGGQHNGNKSTIATSMDAAVCAQCHATQPGEWYLANHSSTTGGFGRGSRTSCSGCHSGRAYIDAAAWANTTATSGPIQLVGSFTSSQVSSANTTNAVITCASCHDPHKTSTPGSRDPSDHQLRVYNKDMKLLDGTVITNTGKAATCIMCHHARRGFEDRVGNPNTTHFDPHHSGQADMFVGTGGFEYPGKAYTNSFHTTGVADKCITCHMATGPISRTIDSKGEHTFRVTGKDGSHNAAQACGTSGCHQGQDWVSAATFDRPARADYDGDGTTEGVQTEVLGLITLVEGALESVNSAAWTVFSTSSNPSGFTTQQLKAVWNINVVKEDHSTGIHNTSYTVQLLQSSYKDLTGNDVPNGSLR